MKSILTTSHLNIGYKSKKGVMNIAENLNLNLEAGKLITLIGANGIGKSTLLRTITGIQKPLSGNVYLNEKEISNYKPLELAQNLSLVLTEKLPPSNLSVFELVALGRQPYTNWVDKLSNEDVVKVQEAMQLTQIEHLASKNIFKLAMDNCRKF